MKFYSYGDSTTYQREIPLQTEELTALAEQHHLNSQVAESNKYEKLAKLLSLDGLTERQRECIQLHFWEGLTERHIANRLSIIQSVVHRHIQSGLVSLRRLYDKNDEHLYDRNGQKIDIVQVFRYAVSNFIFKKSQEMNLEATG